MIYLPLPLWTRGNENKPMKAGRYRMYYSFPLPDSIAEKTYNISTGNGVYFVESAKVRPQADEIVLTVKAGAGADVDGAKSVAGSKTINAILNLALPFSTLTKVERIWEIPTPLIVAALGALILFFRRK